MAPISPPLSTAGSNASGDKLDNQTRDSGSAAKVRGGRLRSALIFLVNVLIACGLLGLGLWLIQTRADSAPAVDASPTVVVDTLQVQPQTGYSVSSQHVGRIEPARQADMAFESAGTINEVLVDEGQSVSKGQMVARLDTRSLLSQRDVLLAARRALQPELERTRLALGRQQKLEVSGFSANDSLDDARLSVARTEAMIEQADASLNSIDILLDKASLRAPFDAIVGARWVDAGATVGAGSAVLTLFDNTLPRVRIGFAPRNSNALRRDITYWVDVDGVEYSARWISQRPDVAVSTRTTDVQFELELDGKAPPAFGQVAVITMEQQIEAPGYWLPVSALTKGERGLWSVLLASDRSDGDSSGQAEIVKAHVDILYTDGEQAYVRADLPTETPVVRHGGHRVAVGQRVQLGQLNF